MNNMNTPLLFHENKGNSLVRKYKFRIKLYKVYNTHVFDKLISEKDFYVELKNKDDMKCLNEQIHCYTFDLVRHCITNSNLFTIRIKYKYDFDCHIKYTLLLANRPEYRIIVKYMMPSKKSRCCFIF